MVVEYRYPNSRMRAPAPLEKFSAYADIETAQLVVANETRSATRAEYRIKP